MFATLEASAVGPDIRVAAVHGTEALCRPFEFHVHFVVSHGRSVDIKSAINTPAILEFGSGSAKRDVCGVLASIRLAAQTDEWALYEALLVPKLWHLGLTKHSRVFTKMSIPDIISEVLTSAGLTGNDFELRLRGSYATEELVVQYRESKLAFLQRWMEHEGIYFFFEHSDGADKIIVVDDRSAHSTLGSEAVRYRPYLGQDRSSDVCFDVFQAHFSTTVKSVKLVDYDYSRPMLDLSAEQAVSPQGVGEMYFHRARFFDPGTAARYAQIRAEELQAQEVVVHASGNVPEVGAGYLFDLSEHPDESYNQSYLVTELVHFCNQLKEVGGPELQRLVRTHFEDEYRVQVTALDHKLQYRPPRRTQRPRVRGYENGVVDGGGDSPYAQIDAQGRYLVKFQFDESGLDGGKASTYVRMMQPHGGSTEGFHFPLRKGTEVIFTFQGGDPDRPVIAGVVPNMLTQSPVSEGNHTQNVIRTGADNHFILDDSAGAEYISLATPKESTGLYFGNPQGSQMHGFNGQGGWEIGLAACSLHLYTGGSAAFTFGGSYQVEARSFMEETINGTVTETYHGHQNTTVTAGGRKEEITGDTFEHYHGLQHTHVDAKHELIVDAGQKIDVTGHQEVFADSRYDDVTGAVEEVYGDTLTQTVTALVEINAQASETHNVTGTYTNEASEKVYVKSPDVEIDATSICHIHGPHVKVTTPKWDLVNPEQSWVTNSQTWLGGIATFQWGTQIDLKATSISATGISMSATGVSISVTGAEMKNEAAEITMKGIKSALAGLKSHISGLTSMI